MTDGGAPADAESLATELEKALRGEPPPSVAAETELRKRLSLLYLVDLGDPLSAAVHVEALLEGESVDASVLDAATSLIEHRPIAARIAEKLSSAYARLDQFANEMGMLTKEVALAKSPRLELVKRRLADLHFERLEDADGALDLLEPLVLKAAGDDDLRTRYVEIAGAADAGARAIRTLMRASRAEKDPESRTRILCDLGELYMKEGELKRARQAFLDAVTASANDTKALHAARRLLHVEPDPGDPKVVGAALEAIVRLEEDPSSRHAAADRLLALPATAENGRAVLAWRALVDSNRGAEALDRLCELLEKKNDVAGLIEVLRARGPTREAQARLIPLLEKAGLWPELAATLEHQGALVPAPDSASLFARLGRIRSSRLNDAEGALAAFARSLDIDPKNAMSRGALEKMMTEGAHRVAAADILERAYGADGFTDGLSRVLVVRAEMSGSPTDRISALDRAFVASQAAGLPAPRLRGLVEKALAEAVRSEPKAVPAWLERFQELATLSSDAIRDADALVDALGGTAVDGPELATLACAAIDALLATGRKDRARAICAAAIATSPASRGLLERYDTMAGPRQDPNERLVRYQAALDRSTDPADKRHFMQIIAAICREDLDDLPRAIELWQSILRDDPKNLDAMMGLISAFERLENPEALFAEIEQALEAFEGAERQALLLRKAAALSKFGEREESSRLRGEILREPNLRNSILESILTAAYEDDQPEIYREALELQANAEDPAIRMLALERLGDFHFERLGDRRAAIDSWKPAARLYTKESPEDEHARELYERVLEASPDDREAAWRLVELYARAGDWVRVPEVYGALLRSEDGLEAAIERLLGLERDATRAGAVDDYVSMVDETVPRLATEAGETRYRLIQAKARVLSADPARQVEASAAHRNVIDSFGKPKDFEAFEAFIESRGSADDRQDDLRWLYEYRASHSTDPANILVEWARVEENYGDVDGAIRVYERCLEVAPSRKDALEALARIKRASGDFEGCVAALRALRDGAEPERAVELDLSIARLLAGELGRPVDAVDAVAGHLGGRRAREALDIMRHALRSSDSRARAVAVVERAALEAADPKVAEANLGLLIEEAGDDDAFAEAARSNWYSRLVELLSNDAVAALDVAAGAVVQVPNAPALWDLLEGLTRRLDRPERAAEAYRKALEHGMSPELGDATGKRIVELLDDSSADSEDVLRTLGHILEYIPGARWALDRIKLVLSAQGRWSDLFELYDRAVEGTESAEERAGLLNEAAVAARDLGRDQDRAVSYLEKLLALRPDDAPAQATLERLYERNGLSRKLIDLLARRVENASGLARVEISHRIASAWLDLGEIAAAIDVTDGMLARGASVDDVKDVLERATATIADQGPSSETPRAVFDRAVSLLSAHYAAAGQTDDSIRLTKTTLLVSQDPNDRSRAVKDLVRLRLETAYDARDAFAQTLATVKEEVDGDPALVCVACETIFDEAAKDWQRRKETSSSDSATTAWTALLELVERYFLVGDAANALAALTKGLDLAFERSQKRELRSRIAALFAERMDDAERAIDAFRELFVEESGDAVAASAAERFSELLATAGLERERAELWEKMGAAGATKSTDRSDARDAWVRAADIWETIGDRERAIAAHEAAAALGSNTAIEALGRLHLERAEWREAAEALEWLFGRVSGEARVRCALTIADAYLHVGEKALARARLAETVAAEPGATAARARLLELYRDDSIWKDLADLLVDGTTVTNDAAERLALFKEAARIQLRELADAERAVPLTEAAIELDPESVELRVDLGEALDAVGRHQDSVTALREAVRIGGERRSKSAGALHRALARALIHAGRPSEAKTELETAARLNPADPVTLYDLSKLAVEEGALDLAERTLRALLLALHHPVGPAWAGPSRAAVYLDLSQILASRGDTVEAQDLVESAFDSALDDPEETERLERELSRRGRHDLVAIALERRLRAAKGPEAAAGALAGLVELWEGPLARSEDLRATIARHAEAIGRDIEESGLVDDAVWATLAKAQTAVGGEGARVDLVKKHLLALTSAAERAKKKAATKLYLDAARLQADELGEVERAATLVESLFKKNAGDAEVWDMLRDLFMRLGRRDRLVELAEAALASTKSSPQRKRLRQDLATLLLEAPTKADEAVAVLRQILEDEPNDEGAIGLLAEVLERERRFDELVAVLSRPAGEGGDPRAAVARAMRLGRALEGASRAAEAGAVYASLVDGALGREELRAVTERLEAVGSDRLPDCIERLVGLEAGEEAGRLARRLVELRAAKADEPGVLRALELGFAAHPADPFFGERLVKAYETAERWAEVANVAERSLAREPGSRELVQKLVDAHQRNGNAAKALQALDAAISGNASDADLLRMRGWLHDAEGRVDEAVDDLEKAYAIDPSLSEDLVAALVHATARETGDDGRRSLSLVELLLSESRSAEARSVLDDLLARSPDHIAGLERLASVAAAEGDWTVAGEACRRLLPLLGGDPAAVARVSLVLAEACERRDGLADAKEALERALELVPGSAEIRRRLAKAYEAIGEQERLVDLLEAEAADATTGAEKASLLLRAAELLLSSGGAPGRALELAEQSRALDQGRHDSLFVQAKALSALGRTGDAIASLRELLKIAKGRGAALVSRAYYELATLHLLGDEIFEAFDALSQSFNADPKNDEAGLLLGLVAIDLDDEKTATRALRTVTTTRSTLRAESKAIAYYHLARIAQVNGDLRRAKLMATNAVAENANDGKARALLDAL